MLLIAAALLSTVGCAGKKPLPSPTTLQSTDLQGLQPPVFDETLQAFVVPPVGWNPDPEKATAQHTHRAWLSPTKKTAYGVIKFNLPFPVGHDLAVWGFMQQFRKDQGEATLLEKNWDESLQGMRFIAQGGIYKVRVLLFVRGTSGWASYAGTLVGQEEIPAEIAEAERAREMTRFKGEE